MSGAEVLWPIARGDQRACNSGAQGARGELPCIKLRGRAGVSRTKCPGVTDQVTAYSLCTAMRRCASLT